jgi:uncharacterized protein (DUF1501 family)
MTHSNKMEAGDLTRRQWLRHAGAFGAALGTGSLAALAPLTAQAQSGYRALVCVFLYGGNDGANMVVPTDATRHGEYASIRQRLALPANRLVSLGGVPFGLHPAMASLQAAWTNGDLAPVFNVGPLARPLTKAQYRSLPSSSPDVPDNLYSHSDQQNLWESSSASVLTRTGWGGRASAALGTALPVVSVGGNGRFGLSAVDVPLVLPGPGGVFGLQGMDGTWAPNVARRNAVQALHAASHGNTLLNQYTGQQRAAFDMATQLGALVRIRPGDPGAVAAIDAAFAPISTGNRINTPIGRQLYQVAKLVHGNAVLGGSRQIFFASQGGYDTHGDQVVNNSPWDGQHARLLQALADAMACFYNAMQAIGMGNAVTLFTQSDFGRTFRPNNSLGTDHAWGNHQLVLGGAVQGGQTYGIFPSLQLGGPDDVGERSWELHGRWIPTTSVDQYAATLLRWMGASEGQLDTVLPNLTNFGGARNIGFL